jgi:hypothetical protein
MGTPATLRRLDETTDRDDTASDALKFLGICAACLIAFAAAIGTPLYFFS